MNTFSLRIVSPDGCFYDGPAQMVRVRSIDGDVAVLAGHVPYTTALGNGECRVVTDDGTSRYAACCGGFLNVTEKGIARLVTATFEWAEDIDVARAEAAREKTRQRLEKADEPQLRDALRLRLQRAEARLKAASHR